MRRVLGLSPVLVLFLALGSITVQSAEIQLDVKEKILSNGMTILVLENHAAPTFAAIIRFNTGSLDERPGITGISHLVEHMMFKGTKNFGTYDYEAEVPIMNAIDSLADLMYAEQIRLASPLNDQDSSRYRELRQEIADTQAELSKYVIKDELWGTYLKHGGTRLNASTGNDGTQYFLSLPKNKLELWALMESDRLANIVFREFYSERDVVIEERRLRTENSPRGKLYEAINAGSFWASPYHWPVVGWMSDLLHISRRDIQDYFASHYSPANAVAAVVGDVTADEVFAMCEKYFGRIPSSPKPNPVVSVDAPQEGERRIEIEYDANPQAIIAWATPRIGHPDLPALEMAANILSRGRTSRFYTNIREKKLGRVSASVSEARNPDAFSVYITPMGNHTIEELEDSVYAEIERLKTEPVSEWELQKIRNQLKAGMLRRLDSNLGLAFRMAASKAVTGQWDYFITSNEAVQKVTAEDVMKAAQKYLTKRNRTVAFITRVSSESAAADAEQTSY